MKWIVLKSGAGGIMLSICKVQKRLLKGFTAWNNWDYEYNLNVRMRMTHEI